MRPVPPFTQAHEALRAEMRAFVETELRPQASFLEVGDAVREVTMAKLLTQRANFELQDDCYGMLADLGHPAAEDLAPAARDARLGPIGGGTDEIMKEILGKTLGS